jgi:5-methylcytosine-specific restriction endonuclease McrA
MTARAVRAPLATLPKRVSIAKLQTASAPQAAAHGTGSRLRGRGLQVRNARILARHPLCRQCESGGVVRPATQLDHIIPLHLGGEDHESNLQGLCVECHEQKTTREARDRLAGSPGG